MKKALLVLLVLAPTGFGPRSTVPGARAEQYLTELIRINTSNPPGNETRVATYLKRVTDAEGIHGELLGGDPARLNFVARLRGAGRERPLLLMAHSDMVPVERSQWTVDPFTGVLKDGFVYGRGAEDDKGLLAAELAVLVELKRSGARLNRDVILLAEADEEAGSTGIRWLIRHAYPKIEAEFALNEGGSALPMRGVSVFEIQTAEKVPTRVILKARGVAGHGSLPRADNPVVHLARAITRLAEADQPVRLNPTTRRYLQELAGVADFTWLRPLLPQLENGAAANGAAAQIKPRNPEMEAMLRTTVSPTMLEAGIKVNVIPNVALAHVDVRRLPGETREEIETRFRQIINDPAVEVVRDPGPDMPDTEPSSLTTTLYHAMEKTFRAARPGAVVVPYMSRGATDGSFLRQKGMAVYGVPLFVREGGESRAHGNDERLSLENLARGTELLRDVVLEVAGNAGVVRQ